MGTVVLFTADIYRFRGDQGNENLPRSIMPQCVGESAAFRPPRRGRPAKDCGLTAVPGFPSMPGGTGILPGDPGVLPVL